MNIGIFTDTYYPIINGVSTSVMMLKKELTKQGHNVYIFTTSNPEAKPVPDVFRLPSMPFYFLKSQRFTLLYPPKLLIKIKKFELDIIHTQTEFPLGIFGKIVSEFYGIPLVHTYHTMYEDYVHYIANGHIVTPALAQKYSRIFCNRAKAVITPTNKAKDYLSGVGVIKPVHVIPTGIDFEPFSREKYSEKEINDIKSELGIGINDPVIVSIGRIGKEKSIDAIINELPKVLKKMPDLKFVIVGDGPILKDLKSQANDLGIGASVICAGAKPWAMIGKYYQLGDLFISASTSETQGLTYIESMAARVPVVAKKDPSVEGVVEHKVTGFYFEKNEDISDVIIDALSDKESLERIVNNAFINIQHLSSQKFGENLEKLYNEVVSAYPKRTTPTVLDRTKLAALKVMSIKNFPKRVMSFTKRKDDDDE